MINFPKVQYIEIDSDQANRRLDNFLLTFLKGVPKTHIYRLIRKGEIRVNKKRIKPDYRLAEGDVIRVCPIRQSEDLPKPKANQELINILNNRILYEDDDLMIINKPAGLAVHGGSGLKLGLIEILRAIRPALKFIELAHRLDRETSGCLIIAKKRSILKELHEMLREGKIEKIYYALTKGHWRHPINHVRFSLEKNVLSSGERYVKVSEEGKEALTEFHVIDTFPLATYMKIKLHTGRTHQIRVHSQAVGHPIAGDEKYGDRAFNKMMKQKGLKRLFLHAGELTFHLASTGKTIDVKAPLDESLQDVLTKQRD